MTTLLVVIFALFLAIVALLFALYRAYERIAELEERTHELEGYVWDAQHEYRVHKQ